MTAEEQERANALIKHYCNKKQIAFLVVLEPVVSGVDNFTAPTFISSLSDKATMEVFMDILESLKNGSNIVFKLEGPN